MARRELDRWDWRRRGGLKYGFAPSVLSALQDALQHTRWRFSCVVRRGARSRARGERSDPALLGLLFLDREREQGSGRCLSSEWHGKCRDGERGVMTVQSANGGLEDRILTRAGAIGVRGGLRRLSVGQRRGRS